MKDSAISFDKTTWRYFLDIGAYSAYFESMYYSSEGIEKGFGTPIFENFHIGNHIIGKTGVFGHDIYVVYDLERHTNAVYVALDMAFGNFTIKNREYAVMAFVGIWGKLRWHTDFSDTNYRLKVTKRGYSVVHSVFETVVFEKKWSLRASKPDRSMKTKVANNTDGISITDIYWFADPFGNTDISDFLDFLKYLGDSEVFLDNGNRLVLHYESIDIPTFPIAKIELLIVPGSEDSVTETPAMSLEPRKNDEIRSQIWVPKWDVRGYVEQWTENSARNSRFTGVPTDEILKLFSCAFPRLTLMNGQIREAYRSYFPLVAMPDTTDLLQGVKNISIPDSPDLLSYSEKSVAFLQGILYLEYIGYLLESQREKTGTLLSDTPSDSTHLEFLTVRNEANLKSLETQRDHFGAMLREYIGKIEILQKNIIW